MNKHLSGNLFTKQALTVKETALSNQIAKYLSLRGFYHDRLNSGKIRIGSRVVTLCREGTPDRFCIISGRIVFVEVKQKDKKPTQAQLQRHEELKAAGAVVLVTDSFNDFEQKFKAALAQLSESF